MVCGSGQLVHKLHWGHIIFSRLNHIGCVLGLRRGSVRSVGRRVRGVCIGSVFCCVGDCLHADRLPFWAIFRQLFGLCPLRRRSIFLLASGRFIHCLYGM